LLCSLKIGNRCCHDPRCMVAINDIQEWLDNILAIEQSRRGDLKINMGKGDWTK
jgi:hypothetical protein